MAKTRYAVSAFTGDGARIHGGRWNSVGTAAVYGADSAALATLEVLVHLHDARPLAAYTIVTATVPDAQIDDLGLSLLPSDWDAFPVPPQVQAIGDAWLRGGRGLALRVPSAVVRDGFNILINPGHIAFAQVVVDAPKLFNFDPRLVKQDKGEVGC